MVPFQRRFPLFFGTGILVLLWTNKSFENNRPRRLVCILEGNHTASVVSSTALQLCDCSRVWHVVRKGWGVKDYIYSSYLL